MRIVAGKAYPTITDTDIFGFFDEFRCFSNFHKCPVTIDGLTYPSSEHAYMAMKTLNAFQRKTLSENGMTPSEAKKYGQTVDLRPGWNEGLRDIEMERVLYAKFTQNRVEQGALLCTMGKALHETNWWGDRYWGQVEGVGEDMLGKILMKVRDSIWQESLPNLIFAPMGAPYLVSTICSRFGEEDFCHTEYSFQAEVHDYNGTDGVLKAYVNGSLTGMPIGAPRAIDVYIDPPKEDHRPEFPQAILLELVIHPSIDDADLEKRLRIFTSELMRGKY